MEWGELKEPLYKFIVENRSMYRDDGADKGQGDIIDFINATVTKDGRKITVDAHAWGGWPIYDYYVDDSWASTGLPEGTIINTYTGTRIYTTIQGAWDHAKTTAGDRSIFCCRGVLGPLAIANADVKDGARISIEGPADGGAEIIGTTAQHNGYVNTSDELSAQHPKELYFRNITFKTYQDDQGASAASKTATYGSDHYFDDCTFEEQFKWTSGHLVMTGCYFTGVHDYHVDLLANEFLTYFFGCRFNGTVRPGNEPYFLGCSHQDMTSSSKIAFDASADYNDIHVLGHVFRAAAGGAYYCFFKIGAYTTVYIDGCEDFSGLNAAGTAAIWVTSTYNYSLGTMHICGNHFIVTSTLPALLLESSKSDGIIFSGNDFTPDLQHIDYIAAKTSGAGESDHSIFGSNAPANVKYQITGHGNLFNPGDSAYGSSGAPCDIADVLYDGGGLNIGWHAFICRFDNAIATVAAGTLAMTNNATNYVEVDAAGTVSANTTAYTLGHIPLGTVVTLSSDITTITEQSATLDESATNIFTAQSVLAATTAHTPAALTVTEQTVVGRLTGGNIAAVSMGIADNNVVQIDDAAAADNEFAKFTAAGLEGRSYAETISDLGALTTAAHTAIGDGAPHHTAVTIGADGEHSLATQVLSGVDAAAAQKGHVQLAGELGGTAASPTVAATHSGSAHHTKYTDAEAIAAVEAEASLALVADLVTMGVNDTTAGNLSLYGGAGGVQMGGRLLLYVCADYDAGFFESFAIQAYEDDLVISHNTANDLLVKGDRSIEVTTGPLKVDHIGELAAAHGVDIDGVLCKDDAVETDAIRGLRETSGPTSLTVGTITDGEYLKRVGATVVSGVPAGGGSMATDPIWAAAGDLAVATGNDAAGVLTKGTDGKVLTMVAGAVAWAAAGGGSGIALWDADADTGIQVEEAADEDKIRFDTAGVERAVWDSTGFDIETHMAVGGAGTPSTAKILAVQEVLTSTGTKSGVFVDVGYAGTHGSDSLYGLNVTSRYQGTSPGSSAATYGLLFNVSYESAQTISNAVGVQGYLNSTAAGSGTWTAAAGFYVSGAYDGSKPATAYGLRIGSGTGPAGVVTFYGVRVEDSAATNPYLLDVGPTTRYFRVIGGAAPAANQTNVYINEGGTLRQVQWKAGDGLVAGDKVLVLV